MSVDCHGMLTVTDTDNNRVQQFQLAARPSRRAPRSAAGQPAGAAAADAARARSARSSTVRPLRARGSSPRGTCRCASAATRAAR